jgi:hypothetical protein
MNKTYELITTKFFLPMQINSRNQYKPYYHAVEHWESLGGIYDNAFHYIYGSDEILIEFMLTYTYAQYVNIKEIT